MKIELPPEEIGRVVDGYDHIYGILQRLLLYEDEIGREREHLWVFGFQTTDTIKYIELVALGDLNRVAATGREVFRMAVAQGCNRILLAHNHPSGRLKHSQEDKDYMAKMRDGGNLLGIEVIDTLIITLEGYASLFYKKGRSPFEQKG